MYNTLDLKSIQLDTLSYVSSRHVAAQGQLAAAQLVFNTVLKFFNNVKDVSHAGGRGGGRGRALCVKNGGRGRLVIGVEQSLCCLLVV